MAVELSRRPTSPFEGFKRSEFTQNRERYDLILPGTHFSHFQKEITSRDFFPKQDLNLLPSFSLGINLAHSPKEGKSRGGDLVAISIIKPKKTSKSSHITVAVALIDNLTDSNPTGFSKRDITSDGDAANLQAEGFSRSEWLSELIEKHNERSYKSATYSNDHLPDSHTLDLRNIFVGGLSQFLPSQVDSINPERYRGIYGLFLLDFDVLGQIGSYMYLGSTADIDASTPRKKHFVLDSNVSADFVARKLKIDPSSTYRAKLPIPGSPQDMSGLYDVIGPQPEECVGPFVLHEGILNWKHTSQTVTKMKGDFQLKSDGSKLYSSVEDVKVKCSSSLPVHDDVSWIDIKVQSEEKLK